MGKTRRKGEKPKKDYREGKPRKDLWDDIEPFRKSRRKETREEL